MAYLEPSDHDTKSGFTCNDWITALKTNYCTSERDPCCDGITTAICFFPKLPFMFLMLPCVGYTELKRCCNNDNNHDTVVTTQPT